MAAVFNLAPHLLITGGVLVGLVLIFLFVFLAPGVIHWFRLGNILRGLRKLTPTASPAEFRTVFSRDRRLSHLWKEYQDSLHKQYADEDGQDVVVAVRSTVPSEAWFSSQFMVDSRLSTDFFKHLPGIFTGVGIIGTFSGLIEGLRHFKLKPDATDVVAAGAEPAQQSDVVQQSLTLLMHAVGDAFLVSAGAITAAMVVTFLEKLLLSALYSRAEQIAHAIDARFDAGAGEEYLSRLVKASEESATQSKILKDALVKELGELLRELTEAQLASGERLNSQLTERLESATRSQVESAREDSKVLAETIATSIKEGLKGPLDEIASTVKSASGDQSSAAIRMLNDVMVSFSQRLNDLFGGQISGINELNKQSAQGMQDAVSALKILVSELKESGRRSSDDMAEKMAAAIQAMEQRQSAMNAQTQVFVEQIRELVGSSQAETQQKLQGTLESLGKHMEGILGSLGDSQRKVFEENRSREEQMSTRSENMVTSMTGGVEQAVKEMAAASRAMSESVLALTSSTSSSIDKLNVGADRINVAATNFASAGDRVNRTVELAASVGSQLTELTGSLTASAGSVQEGLRDYRAQRESLGTLLADVKATIEHAKREASVSADVLQRIEQSATKLADAQRAAEDYMEGVTKVLGDSTDAFRDAVVSTLGKVNHDFHEKLSGAVGLLSTAVQELEVTLGSLAPRR